MDREWLSRFGALILIIIVGWSVLSGFVLFSPSFIDSSLYEELKINKLIPPGLIIALISGLVTLVLGFSGRSPANEDKEAKSIFGVVGKYAPQIAAPIFALALIILISHGTTSLMDYIRPRIAWRLTVVSDFLANLLYSEPSSSENASKIYIYLLNLLNSDFWYLIFWISLFGVIWITMGLFININKFSLHAMYRERLIRAYLGASRTNDRLKTGNSLRIWTITTCRDV